ncbi:hypothetical protein NBT05_10615 [Aquimarina sp. ERC-38]|uniref:DUF6503 family protein n=1 Tax=Aquimarina sp. ERC-38 TaxID=2949996 RepID=UPI0022470D86|nr:DUF6503 family protein [Aquimarina sp. ERC-38]UZO79417.1 hypothetical protein NBT05_10615 [Aquimarina sp. ERC-38]
MKRILAIIGICTIISCKNEKKTDHSVDNEPIDNVEEGTPTIEPVTSTESVASVEDLFVKTIEKAHQKETFLNKKAVSFNIKISFGGKERFNGTVLQLTNSSKIILTESNGDQVLFDGKEVYLSPEDAKDKGARFNIFTWSYFFALPYKLNDPGTKWAMEQDRTLYKDDVEYATAKLTFGEGVGDAPDDWYLVYRDPASQLIKAAVYIVTFGSKGDIAKAEADPHAIVYDNYEMVENIPIATSWKFYEWSEDKGLGKELGEATLSNIKFLQANPGTFVIPDNAKKVSMP